MKKVQTWFLNLSHVAKVSTVAVIVLGGMFGVGASTPPLTRPIANPKTTQDAQVESQPAVTTKIDTETEVIAFEKSTQATNSMNVGETRIDREGVDGVRTITHTITLKDGVEVGRESAENITTEPIAELTLVGTYTKPTPVCDQNYSGCVPVVSYDLDCVDIGHSVTVYGNDPHGFDRDRDGYGCESY